MSISADLVENKNCVATGTFIFILEAKLSEDL